MNQISQILRRLPLWAALALLPGYSYSEGIVPYHGYTGNAAANGLTWSMGTVLPNPPGLDINAVIYNYTIQKEQSDSVVVHVQNQNANGTGYVFRSTDEWRPGSLGGTEINKVVGVGPIHRSQWGDGSIQVEGNGSVTDPSVVYTYRVDPCYDPQFSPACPGYKVPMPTITEVNYDLDDGTQYANRDQYNPDDELYNNEEAESDEEKAEREKEEKMDSRDRLEKALAAANTSAMFALALSQSQILDQMNLTTNLNTYYSATIPGGAYRDSTVLVDKQLPDNRQGLRNNMAQQRLHQQMVEQQYK
jgi:hypothetical protein